jgi:hypothetical protein
LARNDGYGRSSPWHHTGQRWRGPHPPERRIRWPAAALVRPRARLDAAPARLASDGAVHKANCEARASDQACWWRLLARPRQRPATGWWRHLHRGSIRDARKPGCPRPKCRDGGCALTTQAGTSGLAPRSAPRAAGLPRGGKWPRMASFLRPRPRPGGSSRGCGLVPDGQALVRLARRTASG